ncbi:MAG: RNA methyltransferase [Acidobacteriota bacterium]
MAANKTEKIPGGDPLVRSRKNRHIQDFRRLDGDPGLRDQRSVLLAEGIKVMEIADQAGLEIETLLISPRVEEQTQGHALLLKLRSRGIVPIHLTKALMDYTYGSQGHQGILGVIRRPAGKLEPLLIPGSEPLFFYGIGIQDPGNVGALVRSADAFGAAGVLLSPGTADPYGRRAVRASMGSTLRVPVIKKCETRDTLVRLRSAGIRCLATDSRRGTVPWQANLKGGIAVLFGAEGTGLSEEVLGSVDATIRIPMRAGVDSINVAAAASLIGYETARRRAR